MEIGNNVFMAYKKLAQGKFEPLKKPNIDCGPGLERIAAAANNDPDMFKTSLIGQSFTSSKSCPDLATTKPASHAHHRRPPARGDLAGR